MKIARYCIIVCMGNTLLHGAQATKRTRWQDFVAWFTGERAEERQRVQELQQLKEIIKLLSSEAMTLDGQSVPMLTVSQSEEHKLKLAAFRKSRADIERLAHQIGDQQIQKLVGDYFFQYEKSGSNDYGVDDTAYEQHKELINALKLAIKDRSTAAAPEKLPAPASSSIAASTKVNDSAQVPVSPQETAQPKSVPAQKSPSDQGLRLFITAMQAQSEQHRKESAERAKAEEAKKVQLQKEAAEKKRKKHEQKKEQVPVSVSPVTVSEQVPVPEPVSETIVPELQKSSAEIIESAENIEEQAASPSPEPEQRPRRGKGRAKTKSKKSGKSGIRKGKKKAKKRKRVRR